MTTNSNGPLFASFVESAATRGIAKPVQGSDPGQEGAFEAVLTDFLIPGIEKPENSEKTTELAAGSILQLLKKEGSAVLETFKEEITELLGRGEIGELELFAALPDALQKQIDELAGASEETVLSFLADVFQTSPAANGETEVQTNEQLSETVTGMLVLLKAAIGDLAGNSTDERSQALPSREFVQAIHQAIHKLADTDLVPHAKKVQQKETYVDRLTLQHTSLLSRQQAPHQKTEIWQQGVRSLFDLSRQLENSSPWSVLRSEDTLGNTKKDTYLQDLLRRTILNPGVQNGKTKTALPLQEAGIVLDKVQQTVIHIGEQKTVHARGQQFMRQLHDLLGKSSLQSFQNGSQQLSIKLHPEHLGRIDIKLIQQNGQIHAQLLTTTKAARDIVESQLPHLRQTFVQQQIPVERIDIQQQTPSYLQQDSEPHDQQQSAPDDGRNEQNRHEDEEEPPQLFAAMLDELTFNEKV
ncbi:flagellar hook-length control protein FliK [Bacillus piscicola]|uniref:flagellar hook-length control protein FliK n=1 Tax=Bacillus piscicola TaxID=1632684 RepID=UPI001F0894C2|nr:flagellar hook-length control protein FliK [Bacillus piscicola]